MPIVVAPDELQILQSKIYRNAKKDGRIRRLGTDKGKINIGKI